MTTKTINLYQFDELTDKAKERARQWWRECESQEFGAHGDLMEAAETAAAIIGIMFRTHAVPLYGGGTRYESNVWWQLDGQGCGASFDASYSYAKGAGKAIRAEFGTDAKLWAIADGLQALQKRYLYGVTATVEADSRSVHEYGMSVYVNDKYGSALPEADADAFRELMRDFARWIHKGIQEEYFSRMEDEYVDDAIKANEYTFLKDGTRE